ncbi:alpha/beta hydrolase [Halomonas cupida]|uniref:alpha/beta hydrolase n=1 Tax=Halomonas cupida TaxID=44933 RepID=UPI003A8F013A
MAMMPAVGRGSSSPFPVEDFPVENSVPVPVALPRSEAFAVDTSDAAGEYWIEVALPAQPAPAEGYPVLYVLDGNARLPLLREARETLTRQGPEGDGSPLLIVGIGYPGVERFAVERRSADFTPPMTFRDDGEAGRGGAEAFLDFIQQQLKPLIAERYSINESRQALFGHSLGGLFTLYTMQQCPQCFRDYIAISPSLWWQGGEFKRQLVDLMGDTEWCETLSGRSLLLGVGGDEQSPRPRDQAPERDVLRRQRAMVDNTIELGERLQDHCPELATELAVFPGEDHGTVLWPAARRIIQHLSQQD